VRSRQVHDSVRSPGQVTTNMQVRFTYASEPGDPAVDNEDFAATSADPARTTVPAPGPASGSSDTPWVAVVLDGVTPMDSSDIGCRHGVAWFARTLGTHLVEYAVQTPKPLAECLAMAIAQTRDGHAGTCDLAHPDGPAATVAAARGLGDQLDYLVLSDASVVLDLGGQVQVLTDHRAGDVSRRLRADGQQPTAPLVRSSRNQPGGYWVAAGLPEAAYEATTGSAPLGDLCRLLLATDGATRLVDTFGALDWSAALDAVRDEGPVAWIARTRAAEDAAARAAERTGARPRGKVHDDATLVLVEPVPA
jgi:Protein phosphatase 2C